ncbi:retropepsin-like aspartic protease family protein [Alkalilacustris brevis]|uniref:retropepsin-like aspartic protease family protein n=1 Tax=Alkalilacustris brevis TaxID=2026338 RepID=UPI000E0D090F|nr:TIGR02281 family clan AA aspartic protease [Alkalilacustris brevis]
MTTDDIGRLGYLALLGAVLLTYMLIANRDRLGVVLRQALLWGLIFLGAIAAYGLWGDIRHSVMPSQAVNVSEGRVEVPRAPDGHYYITLEIEGEPVRFVVDTGATDMVISHDDARRIGLDPDTLSYTGRAQTANGVVRTARVTLDRVSLGGIVDRNVTAWVNEGELGLSLLGMSYLQRFARIEIERDRLLLTR